MNVFDCHVNRSPMRGRITNIAYRQGSFLNAGTGQGNANRTNAMASSSETKHGEIGVVQIAGLVARRILCFVNENEPLDGGRAYRPDPFRFAPRRLPARGQRARVSVGQRAIAGETVIAEFGSLKGPIVSRRS